MVGGHVLYEAKIRMIGFHEKLQHIIPVGRQQHIRKGTGPDDGKSAGHEVADYLMEMLSVGGHRLGTNKLMDTHAGIYQAVFRSCMRVGLAVLQPLRP